MILDDISYGNYFGEPFRIWLNGIDLSDYLIVLEVKGRSLSGNEIIATQKTDGSYRFKKKRKIPKPLIVKAILVRESENELRNAVNILNGILNTDGLDNIKFSDEPEYTYECTLNSVTEEKEVNGTHILTMEFWRPGSYKLKKTHDLAIQTSYVQFKISGQCKTTWTSKTTFTAPATQFTLETNKGQKIILNYNFITGDVLEIDYKKRKITLNNNNLAVAISLSTVWFELEPGQVQIKASHPTTLTYTERFY